MADDHLMDCMLCGCCSYVCPSNIPLSQLFAPRQDGARRSRRPDAVSERAPCCRPLSHRVTAPSRRRTATPHDHVVRWWGALLPDPLARRLLLRPRRAPGVAAADAGLRAHRAACRPGAARCATARRAITGLLLGLTLAARASRCGWPSSAGCSASASASSSSEASARTSFNPALVGRAFLQAAFPVAITTWPRRRRQCLASSRPACVCRRQLRLPLMSRRGRRSTARRRSA